MWTFINEPADQHELEFKFIRTNGATTVEFQNLQFGFDLFQADSSAIIQYDRFPRNSLYISSDQPVLEKLTLNLNHEDSYKLDIWSSNNGVVASASYEFTTPIPSAPWPSWSWSTELKVWEPPTPKPEDSEIYIWNEDTVSWDIVEY
jgi:hypothetical protein